MAEKEEVKLNRMFTAKSLIAFFVVLAVTVPLNVVTWLYTTKGEVIPNLTLPFFYIVLLSVLMGKINRRLQLSPSEMVPIFIALTSVSYFVIGEHIEETLFAAGSGLGTPELAEYFQKWVPSYMFPQSSEAISMVQNGLQPGQSVPWAEFALPIMYWSTYTTLGYLLTVLLTLGLWGRRWTEVENLLFPHAVAPLHIIQSSADIDSQTGKHRWLSLGGDYKIFWVAFALGVAGSIVPIVQQFIPITLPGTQEYGATPVEFHAMAALLPSSMARATWEIGQFVIWILLPTKSLVTMVLVWLIFAVIYPTLAVQAGLIPYEPGVEFRWSWDNTPGNWYPLPYEVMWIGVLIGFGIVTLWGLRGQFREMYESLTGKDKVYLGLSLRTVTILLIIVTVSLLAFFVGSGVPPLIAIIMLIMAYIVYTFLAKLSSMYWMHVGDFMGWGGQSVWMVPGAHMGYWPYTPSLETGNYAAFATVSMAVPFNATWTIRCGNISHQFLPAYKMAHETKSNMKDVLKMSIIVFVAIAVLSYIVYTWFLIHGGGIGHTASWGSWVQWWKYDFGLLGSGTNITGETNPGAVLPWYGIGIVLFLIIYGANMKIPGFPIDPAAFAFAGVYIDYNWLNAIMALVLKVVLTRIFGAQRTARYIVPIASGVFWGYYAPIVFAWFIEFTTVVMPTFQSFFVP